MVVHFYPELWSISKDISIKGKLAGRKNTLNRKVKSTG